MPRKNPFLGFGRGGYFSTSRTYKLQHPKAKGKATSKRGRKVEVEEREEEESKYGKYYERLSPGDKAKVRSMMRNPDEAPPSFRTFGSKSAAMKYKNKWKNRGYVTSISYNGMQNKWEIYVGDKMVRYPTTNPGKGTVLIIKNPAPWFGGGGRGVRNPSIFDYEDATRAGYEDAKNTHSTTGMFPRHMYTTMINRYFTIWWRNNYDRVNPTGLAGNKKAYVKGFKSFGK